MDPGQQLSHTKFQGNIMFQFVPTTGQGKKWGILIFGKKMELSDRFSDETLICTFLSDSKLLDSINARLKLIQVAKSGNNV